MTLKRSGFKRPEKPAKAPKTMQKLYRQGVAGPVTLTALPKSEAKRNQNIMAMAKGKPCLIEIPGICNHNPETTVAAHSNWHEHGKSLGRKADDQYTVWACSDCHHYIDANPTTRETARHWWHEGHKKQVDFWIYIANHGKDQKEKSAAQWALEQLKEKL